jgi:hypothetical protein
MVMEKIDCLKDLLHQSKRKIIMFKDGNGSNGSLEERENNGHEQVTTYRTIVQTPCKKDCYPKKTTQGGKGGSPKA